jgi:hypothetical protein
MQIKVLDKVFECDNQISAVESTLVEVNQLISESKLALSCLEIDGIEVYEEYYQYIIDNVENIEMIVVKIKPLKEMMDDTIVSIEAYVLRAIPEIQQLADEFSQNVSQDSWVKLAQLLEGLQYIVQVITMIMENKDWYHNSEQYGDIHQELVSKLSMLREAMENQDRTSMSDLLIYEMIPFFEELVKEIKRTIVHEQQQVM